MRQLVGLALAATLLAACSESSTFIRNREVGGVPVLATTADVRLVMRRDVGTAATGITPVVCTEPSPDVAKALSTISSGQGSISLSLPIAGAVVNGAGSAAATRETSEQLAQLTDRVPTIQALRDGLYRACEAYANRAIGRAAYALVLSRYGELLTTLLLSEAVAKQPRPGLVTLGGKDFVPIPAAPTPATLPDATPAAKPAANPAARPPVEPQAIAADPGEARLLRILDRPRTPTRPSRPPQTRQPAAPPRAPAAELLAAIGGNAPAALEAMQFNYLKLNHVTPMLVMCANANDPTLERPPGAPSNPEWLGADFCRRLAMAALVSELDYRAAPGLQDTIGRILGLE